MKAKRWINDLPEYIPGKTLQEISEKYGLEKVHKLASNENIFGPSKKVKELIARSAGSIKYYPDADSREIKKVLSEDLGVDKNSLIMGNGTDQIIEMLCDCFIGQDDNIVIADPTFLIYEKAALKCNGQVIKVPLKDNCQDVSRMVDSIGEDTKIIFLTNPHNPTGTSISSGDLRYALDNTPDDVIIALDEAYFEYLDGFSYTDTVQYIKEKKNLIVLRTFSKIYGLAGLRIGYGIAASEIISTLDKVRLPFNVNLLAQQAAVVAFKDKKYISDIRKKVEIEKKKFYNVLDELGVEYIRSYANFILINVSGSDQDFSERLLEKGFIVRPGSNLGVPGYIRVTISLPETNDDFIKAFKDIICKRTR